MSELNIPVLLLVFNRLDVTQRVFASIREARPSKLYIACDGPRTNKIGEDWLVNTLRQYLLSHVDWRCEVITLFRDENLGCGLAVSQAITWFFEHESMGIILEDDCLPSSSFFKFCDEMLYRYKDDKKIWQVSGYSLLKPGDLTKSSYYFSRMTQIWGWASWADRWQQFDLNMTQYTNFIKTKQLNKLFSTLKLKVWHKQLFDANYKKHDTWDCQWYFAALINGGLSITPQISLVQNLGFGDFGSAHPEVDHLIYEIKADNLEFPLIPPQSIAINERLDNIYFKWRTKNGIFRKLLLKPVQDFDRVFLNGQLLRLYKKIRS